MGAIASFVGTHKLLSAIADTPETVDPNEAVQCMGPEAVAALLGGDESSWPLVAFAARELTSMRSEVDATRDVLRAPSTRPTRRSPPKRKRIAAEAEAQRQAEEEAARQAAEEEARRAAKAEAA